MKISKESPQHGKLRGSGQETLMHIGQVSDRLGLSLRSIRYYEETGLVSPSSRTPGGFRQYSEADVQRLLLVMQMKPLDYSLDEMRTLLETLDRLGEGPAEAGDLDRVAEFADDVEERWERLRTQIEVANRFRTFLREELAGLSDHPAKEG